MDLFPKQICSKNGMSLSIDIAKPEQLEEVSEFLRQHFFSMEPNCYLVGHCPSNSSIERLVSDCLRAPVSLEVRDSEGKLVAIRLNQIEKRSDRHLETTSDEEENELLIVSLLRTLDQGIDLFQQYRTNLIFSLSMMAVDRRYCQLGLARTLVALSFDLARSYGAGAIRVYAVNEYAARVASSYGMITLKTVDYATFQFNGDRPLASIKKLLTKHPVARYMAGIPSSAYRHKH